MKQHIHSIYYNHLKMEGSSKRQPIVFNLDQPQDNFDYHLVYRSDLKNMDSRTMKKRIDELNMRVQFARKKYRGTFDERHKKWMQTLVEPMKSQHKVHLSLDALIAASEGTKMLSRRR